MSDREWYTVLVVRQPTGVVGASVYYYMEDGKTPDPNPVPLHTADYPELVKIGDVLGSDAVAAIVASTSALEAATAVAQQAADEQMAKELKPQ